MDSEKRRRSSERDRTDASLGTERQKVDEALADRLIEAEKTADAVIEKARARADELLARTRAANDRRAGTGEPSAEVQSERREADQVLHEERAEADEVVRAERAGVVTFLAEERRLTDGDLSRERERSDDAIAARDELLGIVSHDLRDLLGAVIGAASLIEHSSSEGEPGATTPEQVRTLARRIQRAGGRMSRLVGDLVDLASIQAGALAVTREPADPRALLGEAVETFQSQAAASGLSLSAQIDPAAAGGTFDPARILQVLANLIGNALKFTASGGDIVVSVERAGEDLRFAVRDTGAGIPDEQLGAVFERFHQLKKADRRGLGLGLHISRSIVQAHGGTIGVESRVGEGSTFWFTLPAH